MLAIYIFLLLLLGFVSFCFPIGFFVFRSMCLRSVYEKSSPVDSASHVKDEKIMKPLILAKESWCKKKHEKVQIGHPSFWLARCVNKNAFSTKNLFADLWVHKNFQKNKTIVILAHGFTDSAAGMAYLAQSYHKRGLSVLAINLRSHGDSEGSVCGLGHISTDSQDIVNWVLYLRKRYGKNISIILHGVSMGGAAVIQAAYGYSLPVKLVVSDCAFSEYKKQILKRIQILFPKNFIGKFFALSIYSFASLLNFFVNGFFFSSNSPKKTLKEFKNRETNPPLLIFHGEADTLTSVDCAKNLYSVAQVEKKLVLIKKAPHIGSWFYDEKKYMDEVFFYLRDL